MGFRRLVLIDFYSAKMLFRSLLKKLLGHRSFIGPTLNILMQQMEKFESGLSLVEIRALNDLGQHYGGKEVELIAGTAALPIHQAREKPNEKTATYR